MEIGGNVAWQAVVERREISIFQKRNMENFGIVFLLIGSDQSCAYAKRHSAQSIDNWSFPLAIIDRQPD